VTEVGHGRLKIAHIDVTIAVDVAGVLRWQLTSENSGGNRLNVENVQQAVGVNVGASGYTRNLTPYPRTQKGRNAAEHSVSHHEGRHASPFSKL
jgi:hypothetical protein